MKMKIGTSSIVVLALATATISVASAQGPDGKPTERTSLESMSLPQALDLAAKASPEIQSARLRVLELQAVAKSTRSGLLPQVAAGIASAYQTSNLQGLGLIEPGAPTRVGPYRVFDARPSVNLRVLDLSLLASVRAAQARTRQSEADAESVSERTRAAIIDLYLQALESDSLARANRARIATAEAVLRQTSDAEQAGKSSKLDVARATQQLEKERAALVDAVQQRDVISTLLLRTIGLDANAPVALEDLKPHSFSWDLNRAALQLEAIHARPERRAIAAKGLVASREIAQMEKQRWPTLAFVGNYGVLGQGPDRALSTWQVGASLTVPIWTSGRIESDIEAARYRRDQWKEEDRQLTQQIEQEITEAIVEGRAALAQTQHLNTAADAAREALELARLRYEGGLTSNLDVVTAQGELAQSEEAEIRAKYAGWIAEAKLARARGNVRSFVDGR